MPGSSSCQGFRSTLPSCWVLQTARRLIYCVLPLFCFRYSDIKCINSRHYFVHSFPISHIQELNPFGFRSLFIIYDNIFFILNRNVNSSRKRKRTNWMGAIEYLIGILFEFMTILDETFEPLL